MVVRPGNGRGRTKVKTGSVTCRIRKTKCDENKTSCQRCTSTGRACDGYSSPVRVFTGKPITTLHDGGTVKSSHADERPILAAFSGIAPPDIELLARCFSTKTVFDVKLDCDEEARHLLKASLTDPSIGWRCCL